MNTKDIMEIALSLAGLDEVPGDSGIIAEGNDIDKILIGVDMEGPEILLAKELGADLVISHHPGAGSPQVNFHNVMYRQIDKMVEAGVPINKAQKALKEQIGKIERSTHPLNYDRAASFARLLNISYMNIHVPIDVITENFVQNRMDSILLEHPRATLKDILYTLKEIPEYDAAPAKPAIRVGSPDDFAGKILVLMAGGTNGGKKVFEAYFEAGVGTIICMHIPEDVKKAASEQNIGNIIVAGHMASDSIGLNIFSRELESRGLTIVKAGGIIE